MNKNDNFCSRRSLESSNADTLTSLTRLANKQNDNNLRCPAWGEHCYNGTTSGG